MYKRVKKITPLFSPFTKSKLYRNNFLCNFFVSAMPSSKKLATSISSIASFIYFLIIIFQVPLFRVPCSFGVCKTPLEVTSSQLIASKLLPSYIVKVLLYPGAIVNGIIKHKTLPTYNTSLRTSIVASDLHSIEILAGSYLCVMGAFIGFTSHGRMSLFGTMLIIWGILREKFMGQFHFLFPTKSFDMYPTLIVAVVCSFVSIRKDVRKLIHIFKAKRVKLL